MRKRREERIQALGQLQRGVIADLAIRVVKFGEHLESVLFFTEFQLASILSNSALRPMRPPRFSPGSAFRAERRFGP